MERGTTRAPSLSGDASCNRSSDLLVRFASCSSSTPLIDRSVRELLMHFPTGDEASPLPEYRLATATRFTDSSTTSKLDRDFKHAVARSTQTVSPPAGDRSGSPKRRLRVAAPSVMRIEPATGAQMHWIAAAHLPVDTQDVHSLMGKSPSADSGAAKGRSPLSAQERASLMRLYHSTGRPADLIAMPRPPLGFS